MKLQISSVWNVITKISLFSAIVVGSISSAFSKERKPNILFISIDDLRPQLSAYGCEEMHTPFLDVLASESRVFSKHYVQVPTCGPSRACLLTGKNLNTTADINHHHLAKALQGQPEVGTPETFVHHFRRNGYRTIGMGKISHNGEGLFGAKGQAKSNELPHSWDEFLRDPENKSLGQSNPLHCYVEGNRYVNDKLPFEKLDVEDTAYPDGRLAEIASKKLTELSESSEPFFMAVGFYKPHLPFTAPRKYWDLYERQELPLAPYPNHPEGVSKVFTHPSSEFFDQYRGNREPKGTKLSEEYSKEVIHANYAATSFVDAQVGKVLQTLKSEGLEKNTVVILWSDHGWCLGDHNIWGKHTVFDRALRSVLMVKTPELKHPGASSSSLVATIDIYPTLCEIAGIEKPKNIDGSSFSPILDNPKEKIRSEVLSYWRNTLSLRTERYHLALYNDGKQRELMLFDHELDPGESLNLAKENNEVVLYMLDLMKKHNEGFLPEL